jgi:hypothetical protein
MKASIKRGMKVVVIFFVLFLIGCGESYVEQALDELEYADADVIDSTIYPKLFGCLETDTKAWKVNVEDNKGRKTQLIVCCEMLL